MRAYLDAAYALLLERDAHPETVDERLDEPLPGELSEAEAQVLEARRMASANAAAVKALSESARLPVAGR